MVELAEDSVMVLLPMSKMPDACKLIGVPEIVTPGPPTEMVVPSIEKAVEFAVKTCPATVYTDKEAPAPSREAGTTMPDAPGVTVWLPITYAPASLAVKVWEPMTIGGSVGPERRVSVLPPITASEASGARLIRVLEIVMAGAPGMSV